MVCGQSLPCNSSRVTRSPGRSSSIASNWNGCSCNLTRLPRFVSSPVRKSASKTPNLKRLKGCAACVMANPSVRKFVDLPHGKTGLDSGPLPGDNLPELFDLIKVSRGLIFQQESSDGPLKRSVFPITHAGQVCNGRLPRGRRIGQVGPGRKSRYQTDWKYHAKQIDCRK